MRYYIIAGEASGDLHASNLVKHLKTLDQQAVFRGWGGDKMEKYGVDLVKHYRDLAFMGFTEVLLNLKTILNNLKFCKKDVLEWKPDVLILVDYPGFNLRIASFAHQKGIKVFYYISPQIWAWKQSRVHQIKRNVDAMFVILPFEQEFYARFGMEVHFEGHPLTDALKEGETETEKINTEGSKKRIALLPGSRKQEIKTMLPEMIKAVQMNPDWKATIAGVSSISPAFYNQIIGNNNIPLEFNKTYELLRKSDAALVTSGTATLEAGLIGVPTVVCYKGGRISYYIARQLIKVKYISLVNLMLNRAAVPELIQHTMNPRNLHQELDALLNDAHRRTKMKQDLEELKVLCGEPGASARIANKMVELLTKA
jgi:lipid-A-disaccharide synthase